MTDDMSNAPPPPPESSASTSSIPPHKKPRPHCAFCGKDVREPVRFGALRPAIANALSEDHPGLTAHDVVCRRHVSNARTRYVAELLERERGELSDLDRQVVESMAREETVARDVEASWDDKRTFGERAADMVADFGGSWNFIGLFAIVLIAWMTFNVWAVSREVFDPYPFILLNLVLSCLAAIQAPIIMMSQKRQEAKDRLRSENDYQVNLKAELEIRHLHEKMDHLINRQWERLAEIQQIQLEIMQDLGKRKR
ncbi:MAG: DUF1003 domain-containing protein [Rhodopseudomonas sp.]|nr:DUF1003 domain-containing protein [Rhodopseudomonas sp.]